MNIYIVIMCIVKKRSLNTLFISSLLNLFLLLSEKSNSIDEIIFSYSALIDTLKSTNIQINRKEFGLTCIVKKSLYSYWYFFHSVYTRTAPLIDLIQPLQSFVRKHRQLISERPEMNPTPTEIYSMSSLFHFHPELL